MKTRLQALAAQFIGHAEANDPATRNSGLPLKATFAGVAALCTIAAEMVHARETYEGQQGCSSCPPAESPPEN